MTKFWLIIGVASLLIVGCAENGSDDETTGTTNELEAVTEDVTSNTTNESQATEYTVSEPETAVRPQAVGTAAGGGLNPAHGQPGHDCDIAVGAPLDGSGGQPQESSAPVASQPVVQPNFSTSSASNGLNPAHGQPGHDCDVAVGAPLPAK